MKQADETQILRRVTAGDANAYSLIVERYKNMAFTLAFRILRNREDAEEAAQDAFLKCYYGLNDFKFDSSFGTWLYRIVYTSSVSLLRKRKSTMTTNESANIDDELSLSDINDALKKFRAEEQKHYVTTAMKALTEEDNALIFLYYQGEKSVDEICSIMDLTKSNVKVKLYRARKKLFDELNRMLKKEVYDLI